MTQTDELQVLTGIVQRYYASDINPNTGKRTPHKLLIDTGEDEVELGVFPKDDGTLPPILAKLDLDSIEGKGVQAIARWNSEYKGRQQYRPTKIDVVNAAAPPVATEPATQTTTQATPPATMTRTEYGMAKGNAISASTALIAAYVSNVGELPSVEFLEEGARLINTTSEAILSGRIVEPDAEEPASDDGDTTGESLGVIQLDGMQS